MMIIAGPQKRGMLTHPLRHLESQHIGIESDRPLQIRDFQVNVTDNRFWVYRCRWHRLNLVAQGSGDPPLKEEVAD